jgi:hypothetical protein
MEIEKQIARTLYLHYFQPIKKHNDKLNEFFDIVSKKILCYHCNKNPISYLLAYYYAVCSDCIEYKLNYPIMYDFTKVYSYKKENNLQKINIYENNIINESKKQQIVKSLYLNYFETIQKENKYLKYFFESITDDTLEGVVSCDCCVEDCDCDCGVYYTVCYPPTQKIYYCCKYCITHFQYYENDFAIVEKFTIINDFSSLY